MKKRRKSSSTRPRPLGSRINELSWLDEPPKSPSSMPSKEPPVLEPEPEPVGPVARIHEAVLVEQSSILPVETVVVLEKGDAGYREKKKPSEPFAACEGAQVS